MGLIKVMEEKMTGERIFLKIRMTGQKNFWISNDGAKIFLQKNYDRAETFSKKKHVQYCFP